MVETFALRDETKQRDLFIHIDLGHRYKERYSAGLIIC